MRYRRDEGVIAPQRGHEGDAGLDLYSPIDFTVPANSFSERIDLGVGFEIPKGYVGLIIERSSMGKKGLASLGPAIDHGYTGNAHLTLSNASGEDYIAKKGDRVAQIIVFPVLIESLEEASELSGERGTNGHGSTGI